MRAFLLFALLIGCSDPNDAVLRAMDAGDLRRAESLLGNDAVATFLRGNIAFHHAAQAERQANTAAAEPFAFDVAIRYAESARDHWIDAAMTRDHWPAAARNTERALAMIADLKRKKDEAIQKQRKESQPEINKTAAPPPPPDKANNTTPEEAPIETTPNTLSPDAVRNLLQQLSIKDRQKREMRQKERKAASSGVERDW
jgi:hypothetical protein